MVSFTVQRRYNMEALYNTLEKNFSVFYPSALVAVINGMWTETVLHRSAEQCPSTQGSCGNRLSYPQLWQMLTNFKNSLKTVPPHLNHVVTLPCDVLLIKICFYFAPSRGVKYCHEWVCMSVSSLTYLNKKASIRWQDSARRQFQVGLRGDIGL